VCWGIALDTGYQDRAESFTDVTIRGNTVLNVGNVGIGVNACRDCVIENNVVVHEQPFESTPIAVPDRERSPDDGLLTHAIVRNNSIFMGATATGTGIRLGGEGDHHVAVSNSIQYAGSEAEWSCFDFDLAPASYSSIDHNLCHAGAGATQWARGRGDLEQWRSYSKTSASAWTSDPAYRSVAPGYYDLRAAGPNSPLIDGGDPRASSRTTRDGRPRRGKPDIGAYEFAR
jgi:parallel beta-helix repeat protein